MKSSGELEKEFVENIDELTGKDLITWLEEIKASGMPKRNDIINWLKNKHGFGHVNASWLAGIFLNNDKLIYQSEQKLLNDQLANREALKPVFMKVSQIILKDYPDATMIPKKTYISFTANREFVAINIKTKEVRICMDLGDHPFNRKVQRAKLIGPMPRLSHMVALSSIDQIDHQLSELIHKSYNRVN